MTSAWKVNLPISLASGSTLSVSYAADLMALLLLGPPAAIAIAAVGSSGRSARSMSSGGIRCIARHSALAAEVITLAATGLVYRAIGGRAAPFDIAALIKPLVGAIVT